MISAATVSGAVRKWEDSKTANYACKFLGQVPSRVRQACNVITLGFDRAVDLSLLISGLGHQKRNRVYKVVKLGPETGEAEFIKIRENVG